MRVRLEKEAQGSERSFRRQAETQLSGLCADVVNSPKFFLVYHNFPFPATGQSGKSRLFQPFAFSFLYDNTFCNILYQC